MIVSSDELQNLVITLDDGRVLVINNKEIKTVDTTIDINSLFIIEDNPDLEIELT